MYNGRSVEVVMPAYNEGKTIFNVIRRVLHQKTVDRLIVVYDKSEDGTLNEIKRAAANAGKRCMLVYSREKRGKGHAVRQGLELVGKRSIIIIQDADEEYYPEDYPKLLRAFGSGHRLLVQDPPYHVENRLAFVVCRHYYLYTPAIVHADLLLAALLFEHFLSELCPAFKAFRYILLFLWR